MLGLQLFQIGRRPKGTVNAEFMVNHKRLCLLNLDNGNVWQCSLHAMVVGCYFLELVKSGRCDIK
jgi:hypothetical protein